MSPFINDPIVEQIIGAAVEVHRELGPGLLESTYEGCLTFELVDRGIEVARQVPLPVIYKSIKIDCAYRVDLVVDGNVLVEVKAVDGLAPIHTAQILTYMRLSAARHALLLNFNELTLKAGMKSFVGTGSGVPGGGKPLGSHGKIDRRPDR